MKKIAIAFFLLCVGTTFSQNCAYLADSESPFDGSKLLITTPATVTKDVAGGKLQAYASLYLNESVMLSFVVFTNADITLAEGDSVQIILSSGEQMNLQVFKAPTVSSEPERKISFNMLLNSADEKILSDSEVEKIVIKASPMELSVLLAKKNKKRVIVQKVNCILSKR